MGPNLIQFIEELFVILYVPKLGLITPCIFLQVPVWGRRNNQMNRGIRNPGEFSGIAEVQTVSSLLEGGRPRHGPKVIICLAVCR